MLYSILSDNIISEYIISGLCRINRNIKHYTAPYIKNYIIPEIQEIKLMLHQIINTMKHSQHHTIY